MNTLEISELGEFLLRVQTSNFLLGRKMIANLHRPQERELGGITVELLQVQYCSGYTFAHGYWPTFNLTESPNILGTLLMHTLLIFVQVQL
jgi:hypothetical protein